MTRFFLPALPAMELAFFWPAGHCKVASGQRPVYCLLTNHYTRKLLRKGGAAMPRDQDSTGPLTPREELLVKVAKEIVVKFIEVGRVSPASFADTYKMVIDTLRQSLKG